jgi:hypothetical protein
VQESKIKMMLSKNVDSAAIANPIQSIGSILEGENNVDCQKYNNK